MALPDYTFIEGFDKYAMDDGNRVSIDVVSAGSALTTGEWTSWSRDATTGTQGFVTALTGTGSGFRQSAGNITVYTLYKTLGVNLPRIIGGMTWQADALSNSASYAGVSFLDGATGQISITFNQLGQVVVKRGAITSSTILGTSTLSYSFGTPIVIEWDIIFDNTSGSVKVYFNGVLDPALSYTGDTCGSANNYANRVGLLAGNNADHRFDHFYLWGYLTTGGSETPALTNPVVQTSWATTNDSVSFTPIKDTMGDAFDPSAYTGSSNASPGANQLMLRKYTCEASGNLRSVSAVFNTTSAGALLKAVIYADNGSGTAPAALIAVGSEVTGTTANAVATLPFSVPIAITATTTYWIGYITNTSLNIYAITTATTLGFRAANTYTSGAPGTAPTMTSGQPSYSLWGNLTGTTNNAAAVSHTVYGGSANYVQSATPGDEDLYDFQDLTSSPSAIYTVAVKALVSKTDTGVRTVNLRAKSGSTTSNGSNAGQALLTSDYFYSSYFNLDPDTGTPWTPTSADAAKFGYQLNS